MPDCGRGANMGVMAAVVLFLALIAATQWNRSSEAFAPDEPSQKRQEKRSNGCMMITILVGLAIMGYVLVGVGGA